MTTQLRESLYQYAATYLHEHGESTPGEVIDGYMREHPDICERQTVAGLRTKLSSQITSEIKWYGEDAPIQRTGNRTIVLRKG